MELLAPQRDMDKFNVQPVDENSQGSFSFSFQIGHVEVLSV
jgi:hypothetical protein